MEFSCSDNLCEFLHVCGFYVNNVEALILDIQVPQVDPEIITTDKSLPITVYRDTINVIGVGVGVSASRNGGYDGVMVRHARELQSGGIFEGDVRRAGSTSAADGASRGKVMGKIILSNDLERFVEHLPQLYRLIVRREQVV